MTRGARKVEPLVFTYLVDFARSIDEAPGIVMD